MIPTTCVRFSNSIIFPIVAHGTHGTHGAYGASTQGLNSDSVAKSGRFLVEKRRSLRCGIEISQIKKRGINCFFYSKLIRKNSLRHRFAIEDVATLLRNASLLDDNML